ncbi:MAG: hypothetical protein EU533_06370, partial [Promethearchaeota archaeon]
MPERTTPFTWIVKNKLAAGWWPDSREIEIYKKEGIKVVVNCSEFDNKREISKVFKYYHINIPDYGTPTNAQLEKFLDITGKHNTIGDPIAVHCVAGCGRTGIMVIAWAAFNGHIPNGLDPVKWIRKFRPC